MLNRLAALALCLASICSTATAQGPGWTPPANVTWEYGSSADLKGARRVFIDTGFDMTMRTNAIKIIHKDIPDLEIVSTPDVADALLLYIVEIRTTQAAVATTTATYSPGSTPGSTSTSTSQTVINPQTQTEILYNGYAVKSIAPDRLRVLLSYGPGGSGFSAGQLAESAPYAGSVVSAIRRRGTPDDRFTKAFSRQFIKAWKEANPGYRKPRK